jgi:hypothetical protein
MKTGARTLLGAGLLSAMAAGGCSRNDPNQLIATGGGVCPTTGAGMTTGPTGGMVTTGAGMGGAGGAHAMTGSGGAGGVGGGHTGTALDGRVLDYNEALRTASFKLVGNAPPLQDILDLKNAADQPTAYANLIAKMMMDPRFTVRMIAFWQNTMKMGGPASGMTPSFDTGPTYAARLVVEGQPFTNLFTATTNTCPTYDTVNQKFVDGSCTNGAPVVAGILTDPGALAQYYGNMAFRRNRFYQEVFVCQAQPAELSATPIPMGAGDYTSPWPFESIAGTDNGGTINFHDTSSAICANCHSTSNHRAPLWGNFDANGQYQSTIQVHVPVAMLPFAQMSDWLPQTPTPEPTAWKFGVPAPDLGAMGAAMAADPQVLGCAVKRMWNYAMSKGDIIIDAADVPDDVVATFNAMFISNGYNLGAVLQAMLVSPDFVRF